MEHFETVLAGEKLELTLEGKVVTLATGGITIQTKCKNLYDSNGLFNDVGSDLRSANLFLDEGDEGSEGIAVCYAGVAGKVKGQDSQGSRAFTSFKEFVQWGKENRFDLY